MHCKKKISDIIPTNEKYGQSGVLNTREVYKRKKNGRSSKIVNKKFVKGKSRYLITTSRRRPFLRSGRISVRPVYLTCKPKLSPRTSNFPCNTETRFHPPKWNIRYGSSSDSVTMFKTIYS